MSRDETGQLVAFFNQFSKSMIDSVFLWLFAEFHSFECFPEHVNSKTVNDRIYERISQTKEVKNMHYK